MKRLFICWVSLHLVLFLFGQSKVGVPPYEMKERKEQRQPMLDFSNCGIWTLETENCNARLSRSEEQIVFKNPSGKITYRTTARQVSIFLKLNVPLHLDKEWDCINVWTYGDHWFWGEPNMGTAMQVFAVFADKEGKIYEINLVQSGYPQFAHKYWFLNHLKFNNEKSECFVRFVGFKLKGENTDVGVEHNVFFNNIYLYKEILKPIAFKSFPDKLPFPLRKETILPINKCDAFKNSILFDKGFCKFIYEGKDGKLVYTIAGETPLGDIEVAYNGREVESIRNRNLIMKSGDIAYVKVHKVAVRHDTLFIECRAEGKKEKSKLSIWYTIKQKSLIVGIKEKQQWGTFKEIHAGSVYAPEGRQTYIPFLKYQHNDWIKTLCYNDLFSLFMFDWYYTNASEMTASRQNKDIYTSSNALYIPRTDGKLNPLQEKIFYNVSPDVHEVFPTIDNPASPMRSMQADRLWLINGDDNLSRLSEEVMELRSKGLDKVTVRYHEGFWREDGESYTFRLIPNPKLGVERIQSFIYFVKSKGWRVGLYSNYTDIATVNSLWNPDWMKQNPQGQWEVSWARCYAPKPQIAWEQQAVLAPQIHRLFNTNHSYCDVHTAVSPMSRVDYDYRVPEAAMMKGVIKRYGMILMNERNAYNGPVYSEGGNHWWYAGLADGNYANEQLLDLPVFPDFSLLKIHPLEMDAGNTGTGYQYLSYSLAYGNLGLLSQGKDAVMRYAFLQPIQDAFVMIPVKRILYHSKGTFFEASDAIKRELLCAPELFIEYESGLQTYINFGKEPWIIQADENTYSLPQYGFLAYKPGENLKCMSILSNTGNRTDYVYSNGLYYFGSASETIDGKLGGKGGYMLKKENFGWEIIPLDTTVNISFDFSLIGLNCGEVKIVGVDREGNMIDELPGRFESKIEFVHQPGFYKYMVIPAK